MMAENSPGDTELWRIVNAGVFVVKDSGYDVTADASTLIPEMARLVPGLRTIDVPAAVKLRMTGPQSALTTHIVAHPPAGNVIADVLLDSTVPGWKGKGTAKSHAI